MAENSQSNNGSQDNNGSYDSSSIKILKGLEAVRNDQECTSATRPMVQDCITWFSR